MIILSLIGVFAYQAYWLTGLYTSMKKDMDNCLIETLQVSDYNEMMERCDSVKRSNETINGYIESSINLDSSALITKVIETEPFKQQKRFGLEINEPNVAILKAGAFRSLTQTYPVMKLHLSSHLYTSASLVPDFPGRRFRVESVSGFGKKELKVFLMDMDKANITIRNFPLSVAELRKRLKLKEGGDDYIFATTLSGGQKVLIRGKKC